MVSVGNVWHRSILQAQYVNYNHEYILVTIKHAHLKIVEITEDYY
jgi:hypothetical protein